MSRVSMTVMPAALWLLPLLLLLLLADRPVPVLCTTQPPETCSRSQTVSTLLGRGKAWEALASTPDSLEKAQECYRIATEKEPRNEDAAINLARLRSQFQNYLGCVAVLENAGTRFKRRKLEKHFWSGYCHLLLSNLETAHQQLKQAVTLLSRDSESKAQQVLAVAVHYHYGLVLTHLKEYVEAAVIFQNVLRLDPKNLNALVNLGGVQFATADFVEAIDSFRRAAGLSPKDAVVWQNLGSACAKAEKWSQAVEAYDRALVLDRGNVALALKRQHCKQQCCDWSGWKEDIQLIRDLIGVGSAGMVSPFNALSLGISALEQKLVAEAKAQSYDKNEGDEVEGELETTADISNRGRDKRVRVAYVSPDFREHPVGFLFENIFNLHDRSRLEIYAYAINPNTNNNNSNAQREKIRNSVEHFVSVHDFSTRQMLERLREDAIDVVVNLGGHTLSMRNEIFAQDLDAVKVLFCGYAGTMGGLVDYIVTDHHTSPISHHESYSEKLGNTLVTFHPFHHSIRYNSTRQSDAHFPKRSEYGLPEEGQGFVYCCFNSHYKIDPVVFDQWLQILLKVEKSVLWLAGASQDVQDNLRKQSELGGVSGDRIIFLEWQSDDSHLSVKSLCDTFLDTLAYNAHMTAADAIYAGIPLVTFPGSSGMASRIGGSIVISGRMDHLVANSLSGYQDLAVRLARNATFYEESKLLASEAKHNSPLFDLQGKVQEMETLLLMMHDLKKSGYGPFHLFISKQRQLKHKQQEQHTNTQPQHIGQHNEL